MVQSIIDHLSTITRAFEILVIDDNSPDKTAIAVKQAFNKSKQVKVFIRKQRGLATAILFGLTKARGKYVAVMDTDYNHNPSVLISMYHYIKTYDLVIGSRYVAGGGMENKVRQLLSLVFNIYIRLLLNHNIHDNLSGFFMIKKALISRFKPEKIFYGFGDYFIRVIYYARGNKARIKEIPVYYRNRTYGISKSRFLKMFVTYSLTAVQLRFYPK